MRSQLFGFIVKTHLTYELTLDCPLNRAATTMIEFLRELDAVITPNRIPLPGSFIISVIR